MSQPREQSPQVSVVIPTRRRPALLRRCLEALQAQQIPAESVEILVCDDGPDAATLEVVESLAQRCPDGPVLRYLVPGGEHGPAAA
ncbi:MAG TPA: glycosyltransferase, partial [Castellaniella sp.]|nr:glycosyltransferase [Castellaniella sp.]